jgi:hypothetical protein
VSTSSSRVVKLLGDAACVRTLMLDTCGCDASLSLSPPPQAAVGADWGCSDAAAIAGMRAWLRALHCRCSSSRCLQGSGAPSRPRAKPPPAEPPCILPPATAFVSFCDSRVDHSSFHHIMRFVPLPHPLPPSFNKKRAQQEEMFEQGAAGAQGAADGSATDAGQELRAGGGGGCVSA